MAERGVPSWLGLALVAVLTLALVATGLAHRLPNPAMEAYAAAGGDLNDLCGGTDGTSDMQGSDCPACHIAGAVILPSPAPAVRAADLVFVAEVVAPRESRALRHLDDPTRASRGPPLA